MIRSNEKKITEIFDRYFARPDSRQIVANSLKKMVGQIDRRQAREKILPFIAEKYGLDVVNGQRGLSFSGRDNANCNKNYEAARKCLSRLLSEMGY
jgi:hypothetical protein